tara:strand:- start:821 stop:952 length:132 start_codon:yes stop_codon:yes gene_type:complete
LVKRRFGVGALSEHYLIPFVAVSTIFIADSVVRVNRKKRAGNL